MLPRARREVYRIYGEDEFFAGLGRAQCVELEPSSTHERLPRVFGVGLLLTVAGAMGVVALLADLATRPGAAKRTDVSEVRVEMAAPVARRDRAMASRRTRTATRPPDLRRSGARARATPGMGIGATSQVTVSNSLATAQGSPSDALATTTAPTPRPAEFGFER